MALVEILKALRPQQWIKNLFIFGPLLFSLNVLHPAMLGKTAAAFGVFCLLAGAAYILNDLKDLEEDKHHPLKSQRPIAAGRVSKGQATATFLLILLVSFPLSYVISRELFFVCLSYFILQVAYSFKLKNVVIVDVFIVAAGFFIRVIAGGLVIDVAISPWLLICTLLLALFIAMSKRRHELVLLEKSASDHRPILGEYSPYLLDQMIAVVTASTVVSYGLYTISNQTVEKFGTNNLIFTLPFVLYGIFRYLYLIHQKAEGGTPEILILKDKQLLIDIFLWIVVASVIIYFRL